MRLSLTARNLTCAILVTLVHGCGGGSTSGSANDGAGSADGSADAGTTDATRVPEGAAVTTATLKFSDIGAAVLISDQFYFTEGPVWDPTKNVLYFSDINAHQNDTDAGGLDGGTEDDAGGADGGAYNAVGGAIYELTLPSTFSVLFQPDGNADGLGLDPQGNIIAAGYPSRSAWRLSASNTVQILAPCAQGGGTCYSGQEVNTPDDITARSDGVIYFTDPTFGSGSQGFATETLPLANAQGVYRLTTDGVLHLEDETTSGPNGVNLSPDEKTLYVAYTLSGQVAKFDVAADGSLSNKTTFATGATVADSMCVDSGGNLYVGTITGLAVYDPAGAHLGTISAGGLIVTNCAFGGTDQKTLFITARTQATLSRAPPLGGGSLYQITNMPVSGIPGQN
jgi:gluconolactonase